MLLTAIGASALAAAGLTFLDLGWPALVVGSLLLFLSFPAGYGWIRRATLTTLSYIGYGLVVGTAFSITGQRLSPQLFAVVFVLIAGAVAVLRAPRNPWRLSVAAGDVVIGVCALVLSAVFLHWGIGEDTAGVVGQLSVGGDNANHLNLIRAIQLGQGYQYSGGTAVPGLLGGMESYPQGFAFLVGYTGWMFDGLAGTPTVAGTVWSSWAILAVQPVAGVVVILLIIRGQLSGITPPVGAAGTQIRPARRIATAAVVVSVVVLLTLYVHLWSFGFQTQMFAMNMVLVAVWLATDPALDGATTTRRALVVLGICGTVVAVASSWYLLAPPAVAVAVLTAWPLIRRPREVPWWLWVGAGGAAVLSCYPVVRGTADSTGQLVMPGGVRIFSPLTGAALLLIAGVVVFGLRHRRWWVEPLPVAFAVAVVLSVGVGLFQLVQAGEFSYYFFKTLYLQAVLAVIPVGLGAALLTGRRLGMRDRRLVTGFVAVAALGLGTVAASELGSVFTEPAHQVDEAVIAQVLAEYPDGLPMTQDVVATGYCDARLSGQTTSWIGGLFTSWTLPRQTFYLAIDRGVERPTDLFAYGLASPGKQILVHTRNNCSLHADFISGIPDNMKLVSDPG
ncbi:hypothetical protein D1871_06085 [Nakamurella silvestris]|nr:hypothetical protein D1871_06085 [Nakamurella silvestris]